jgi:hypothetical protein
LAVFGKKEKAPTEAGLLGSETMDSYQKGACKTPSFREGM